MSEGAATARPPKVLWADHDLPLSPFKAKRSGEEGRSSSAAVRLNADPDRIEKGMAQLVLTVIELLRQLMERQALRRVERGTLTDEQEEQLGTALMRLAETMDELKEQFELTDEDLNLHLGPLGDLL
jgi:hypothetical protein